MAFPSGNYNLLMYVTNVDEFYLFSTVDPVVSAWVYFLYARESKEEHQ